MKYSISISEIGFLSKMGKFAPAKILRINEYYMDSDAASYCADVPVGN